MTNIFYSFLLFIYLLTYIMFNAFRLFFLLFFYFLITASRKHGLIEVSQDGRVFFVDVGSSNGTEVDMIHISTHGRVQLKSGSRIRIGDTYYFCLLEDGGKQKNNISKTFNAYNL